MTEEAGSPNGKEIVKGEVIPPEKHHPQKAGVVFRRSEMFAGPLPPPHILGQYNDVVKDGAERLFRVFEERSQHRIKTEETLMQADIRRSDRGLIFGFVLALVIIAGGFGLIIVGMELVGIAAVLTPLATMVGAFVVAKQSKKAEQADKPAQEKPKPKPKPKPKRKRKQKPKKKSTPRQKKRPAS